MSTTKITEGSLVLSLANATAGAGNGETLDTGTNIVRYDPNGASRTGVILKAGTREGQIVTIVNIADAAETITFAAAGTSNVSNGVTSAIARYGARQFVWDGFIWYPLI